MRSRINTWYCWVWSIGVADIATQNQTFVALVASVIPFQANPSHFFVVFDSLVAITTHPGAQNSRSGRFRVNDDNRRTKRLLYPLLRMRARGNNTNLNLVPCIETLNRCCASTHVGHVGDCTILEPSETDV